MKPGLPGTRRWLPRGRLARRSRGLLLGGIWLRFLTRWHRLALDVALAEGLDPIQSDELSLRAGQLRSVKTRTRLAVALDGAVELANRRFDPFAAVTLRRAQVQACGTLLRQLAERLREAGLVEVQGLAMASLLVTGGASPLYADTASVSLRAAVSSALNALEPSKLSGDRLGE